jgi:hypothetical protein
MELTSAKLQQAVQWVNERRRAHGDQSTPALLDDASRRFDLDLEEQSRLLHLFRR